MLERADDIKVAIEAIVKYCGVKEVVLGLEKGTILTVYYSATLNENANIVVDGNDNTVYLSYGEDSTWETAEHKTTTYTWKIDVLKFAKDGENQIKLAG